MPAPPRPVADVPPPPLADGEAVAKAWLLALVGERPLGEAPAVATARFAAEAPRLCAAALRAVGSDRDLEHLRELAVDAAALAGAHGPAQAAAAVALLRGALWGALLDAAPPRDAPATAALAERVGFVADAVLAATLAGEIRVEDARGAPAWRAALERALADPPCCLLWIEADDVRRLVAADADGAAAALDALEGAVAGELGPDDALGREDDGRLWVVAPGLDAAAGRDLAERLAQAIATAASLRGAPLRASIGIATCPDDGSDADALAARADEGVFAARAAGLPTA